MLLLKKLGKHLMPIVTHPVESISQGFPGCNLQWHVGPTSAQSSCLSITGYSIKYHPGTPESDLQGTADHRTPPKRYVTGTQRCNHHKISFLCNRSLVSSSGSCLQGRKSLLTSGKNYQHQVKCIFTSRRPPHVSGTGGLTASQALLAGLRTQSRHIPPAQALPHDLGGCKP